MKKFITSALLASTLTLSGCGYNNLQALDEDTNAKWSEVVNQYQRRADLVPNLVAVVERYAEHEKEVLTEVAQARSRVGSVQLTPETLNDPNAMKQYQEAQAGMTSALSRLMMVTENYPQLKADGMFQDLQAQLEGTENRITVARNNYIQSVQGYNTTVRQFPTNLTAKVFGMQTKANFSVENEQAISTAPTVNFGNNNNNANSGSATATAGANTGSATATAQ
ncbi:LemA family [Moraxella lacunata]|uniref:LemA family n=1 Tax=Moraxella lacunata TaxID=477 RepID=A0A378TRE5_MORLA|nr:LemA family protein [Moraxella lacunata]STZ63415.1 LemA family [Moraxella lacunata]